MADAVVDFVFGGERVYFERERPVWGIPVRFRVLSATDALAADLAAERVEAPAAATLERGIQWLARSVVAIDGQPYAGPYRPGGDGPADLETLRLRLEHLHGLPALLVHALVGAFGEVSREYAALLSPESVGE